MFDPTYSEYGRLLSEFVKPRLVDYAGLASSRASLKRVVTSFAFLASDTLQTLSTEARMAFYINAYNAITLLSIVEVYPLESIHEIEGVWDTRRWNVAGEQLTLDQIEHDILRPQFQDPRVHFALNCASVGCPPLQSIPFQAGALSEQLDNASRSFLNDTTRIRYDVSSGVLHISELFKWFAADFLTQEKSEESSESFSAQESAIVNYIAKSITENSAAQNFRSANRISYSPYDWSLNDIKR